MSFLNVRKCHKILRRTFADVEGFFEQIGGEIVENRHYYYARVSSTGQNLARQIEAFKADGANDRDIVTDKQSGKDLDRPGYQALKTTLLRCGDTLTICSLDRLSRSKSDIKNEIGWLQDHGVRLRILNIPTTLNDAPAGQEWVTEMVTNILIEVLSAMAEEERRNIRSRQAEGIAAKRNREDWQDYGRPHVKAPDNWQQVMQQWRAGEITATEAMRLTGIRKTTFYKLAKEVI